MAWNSSTFKRREQRGNLQIPEITVRVDRHRAAMEAVIKEALEITKDRVETTREIRDPNLRKGVTR
jgi:hypothetical protein